MTGGQSEARGRAAQTDGMGKSMTDAPLGERQRSGSRLAPACRPQRQASGRRQPMAREERWYGQARLGGCRLHNHHRRKEREVEISAPGIKRARWWKAKGKDRMEAPRMNRLRETATPRSRRLQQITGSPSRQQRDPVSLGCSSKHPCDPSRITGNFESDYSSMKELGAVPIVPPSKTLFHASPRSGIGLIIETSHFTSRAGCRVTVFT